MKPNIIYSIIISTTLLITFLLNILLYLYSDNYDFFLKKMKYGDELIKNESKNITDNYNLKNQNVTCTCESVKNLNCNKTKISDDKQSSGSTLNLELNELFTYFDRNILKEKKYDEYYQIFNITDQYPSEYKIYYNQNYEIYLFYGGKFEDVYNIFELLSKDKTITNKFNINKNDLYGKQSFFINTNINDGYTKLIISNGKILFGLKVKKDYYNEAKLILEKF